MLPPYSADAEQAGDWQADRPGSLVSVADVLQPDDFAASWALAYEWSFRPLLAAGNRWT